MARFTDRGVVVTGAAQGIGRGIVQAFLDEGARVFAADVRADGLEGTRALAPDRVVTHTVDLADFDATKAMARAAIERLGRVHALVNCAGVMPGGPLMEVTRETFDLTFAVNARAPLATMQVIAPHMIEHGGGAIVNIASANAFKNESPEGAVQRVEGGAGGPHEGRSPRTRSSRHQGELRRARSDGHPGDRGAHARPTPTCAGCSTTTCGRSRSAEPGCRETRPWPCSSSPATMPPSSVAQTLIVDGGELGGGDWYDPADEPPRCQAGCMIVDR